jgi:[phosphatase 2A protein]-leucine-carboxy methyltransferase
MFNRSLCTLTPSPQITIFAAHLWGRPPPSHLEARCIALPMSAPQIPNLNTLRRGGGRPRLRGRGDYDNIGPLESVVAKDNVVQGTDSDASISRLSAVELGYLTDPFASVLKTHGQGARRYPLINRGTLPISGAVKQIALLSRHPGPDALTTTSEQGHTCEPAQ